MEEIVEVVLPAIDVSRAAGIAGKIQAAFEALWIGGRLRSLVESPEGQAAVAAYEEARTDAERQLNEAAARGIGELRVRVRAPAASASLAIAFGRRFIGMVGDRELMTSLGAQPLPDDDLRILIENLGHAEGVLAGKLRPLA